MACGGGGEPTPPRESRGVLRVVTATSGQSPDADGYSMTVDASAPVSLPTSGVTHVGALAAGSHSVNIAGIASNCTPADASSRTVNVVSGDTTNITFAVACSFVPTTGIVVVRTQTTGGALDADGYTVSLDGGTPRAIAINAEVRFTDVTPGSRTLSFAGVAANCQLAGTAERTASVVAGDSAVVTYEVTCTDPGPPNTLIIHTITTGDRPDSNGYVFVDDFFPPSPNYDTLHVAVNDSVVLGPYPTGWEFRNMALSDVAGHCRVNYYPEEWGPMRADRAVRLTVGFNCWNVPPACVSLQGAVSSGTTPTISWTGGCPIYRLVVFDPTLGVEDRFRWDVYVPFTADDNPVFGPVTYGVLPAGMREASPLRPLIAGRRYMVEVELWYSGGPRRALFEFTP